MKTVLLVGFLSLLSLMARAQTYYLNLAGEQLEVPDRQVAVEQVLDGRADLAAIGFVYRGLGNKPATVLFKRGMEPELTEFVQARLPARPTDHPVVLCLRRLHVSEVLGGMTESATASLALDVYAHLPDGYHFVLSAGAHTSDRGLETTRRHAGHLAKLLSECLAQLAQADWSAVAAQPARTLAQLPTDQPTPKASRRTVAAILREAPRRGIYFRFEQFLANEPDTAAEFTLDTLRNFAKSELASRKWQGVARVRLRPTNIFTRQALQQGPVWGFCDGQQLFVQQDKQYFPLARQGNFFTFVGEAPLDREYMQARTRAQARAAFTVVAPINAQNHTGEPLPYALDMRTGELTPYSLLPAPTRADTAYIYVYRPAQMAGPATVAVLLNGREAGQLRPGEYLELHCPYSTRPVQLCLSNGATAAPCQYLMPNTARPNYLKVSQSATAWQWQWVPTPQGEADLDELDKLRK